MLFSNGAEPRITKQVMMRKIPGIRTVQSLLLILAAAALFAAPSLPIWRITLDAPQYPEGMGMLIWAHTITGENTHDLAILNQLNHYIGMKAIVPESIPELRFMRPLIFAFGALCLLAAIRPRLWSTATVLGLFIAAGLAGMVDFWYWGYDYGHKLDPKAAIKVPGASFQPPLIGPGSVLNFQSYSWPAPGGLLLLLAGLLIAGAGFLAWRGLRNARNGAGPYPGRNPTTALTLAMAFASSSLLSLAACGQSGPATVHWGEDACHFCRMTLVQKGFDAQRVNEKGKVAKFDAVECMLGELEDHPVRSGERLYVSDWSRPESPYLSAEEAVYLQGGKVPSPMGGALAAFASADSARAFQTRFGGNLKTWAELAE